MSIVLTNANGRADMGASPPTPGALTGLCWYWQNSANYYDRRGIFTISTTTGDESAATHLSIKNVDGLAFAAHRHATAAPNAYVGTLSKGSWQMVIVRASTGANSLRIRKNPNASQDSISLSGANPMAAFRYLTCGAWSPNCPDDHITKTAAIAHLTWWNRDLTDEEVDGLYNSSGTSPNPTTLHPDDIFAYWSGASLTAEIGGWVFSSVQGTLSIDNDNVPNVDAYSPGGGFNVAWALAANPQIVY